jgi:hypothetical protein
MNAFYHKVKEVFHRYECRMYDCYEIILTPKRYLNVSVCTGCNETFKIETFISELDDFLKANPCHCDNVYLKFKILIKDRFKQVNCYGFTITRSGIDDVGLDNNIVIKDFNKNEITDLIMRDVNKESFLHIVDISLIFI